MDLSKITSKIGGFFTQASKTTIPPKLPELPSKAVDDKTIQKSLDSLAAINSSLVKKTPKSMGKNINAIKVLDDKNIEKIKNGLKKTPLDELISKKVK